MRAIPPVEIQYVNPHQRRQQRQGLKIINDHEVNAIGEGLPELPLSTYAVDLLHSSSYGHLSARLHEDFVRRAVSTKDYDLAMFAVDTQTRLGFLVLGSVLSFAPDAYTTYAQPQGIETSARGLGDILLGSAQVLDYFAKADEGRNTCAEVVFGLRATPPTEESNPFIVAVNDLGEPQFTTSPVSMAASEEEITRHIALGAIDPDPGKHRSCPAVGRVIAAQWSKAVEWCVTTPELFPQSLALGQELR
jgi:hypothetical protein